MEKELQNENPAGSGDTCGGKPRPAGTKDFTCENGVWVEVDIPEEPNVPTAP